MTTTKRQYLVRRHRKSTHPFEVVDLTDGSSQRLRREVDLALAEAVLAGRGYSRKGDVVDYEPLVIASGDSLDDEEPED